MIFWEYLGIRWQQLLVGACQHVGAVFPCRVVATVLGVLTGVLTHRTEWAGNLAITMTASILTVPSLALLGLLVPVVGLGVAPAVIALTLYGLLPVVRNAVVGLRRVDPGADHPRRRGRHRHQPRGAPPHHRLRHPGHGSLPAHDRHREHRARTEDGRPARREGAGPAPGRPADPGGRRGRARAERRHRDARHLRRRRRTRGPGLLRHHQPAHAGAAARLRTDPRHGADHGLAPGTLVELLLRPRGLEVD